MNLHRWLDVVSQKNMWRYPRPPIESAVEDVERLARLADESPNSPVRPSSDEATMAREGGTTRLSGRPGIEEHFSFSSQHEYGDPTVDTVHVVRWRPEARRDAQSDSALVMVHGACAPDHGRVRWFVPPVWKAPWDTFSLELPHHMRRQRPDSTYSGEFFVTADLPRLVRAMHQGEADLRALIRGLRALGYRRIVLGGISIGGNIVFEAVLREPVDAAFALAPPMDAYASLWDSIFGQCIRAAGNAAGITDATARRALRLVTPRYMGRPVVSPERLLLIYGENDLLCPAGAVRELRDAWGVGNERVLETGHATLVLRFWTVRRTVAAWMRAITGLDISYA